MFSSIISVENLLAAWREFLCGKKKRADVAQFSLFLIDNIYSLHRDLESKIYRHGMYTGFKISDPKPRDIHKAPIRDRLLHHAIYRVLYPYLDHKFVADSYSCREGKGTHKALDRFRSFSRKVGENNTRTVWVLKCDIKKFFANIDHAALSKIIRKHVSDEDTLWLLNEIIGSFHVSEKSNRGLPLGNLTSQLLVNVYMNEFDQFMKHELRVKHYIRYADDFVVMSSSKKELEEYLPRISKFLLEKLKLSLHPDKVSIKTLASGVDFLGWIHFPDHRILRTATKRRMLKRISNHSANATLQSYLGLISHGNTNKLRREIISLPSALY